MKNLIVLIISISLFGGGCVVRSVKYPLDLRFDQTFTQDQKDWISTDFNRAYSLLKQCKNEKVQRELFLRETTVSLAPHYKKYFSFLNASILPLETNIIDQYINQSPPKMLCAYVRPNQPNTIYINNINNMSVFRKPFNICKDLWNTFGHEMLHILQFDHSTQDEFNEMNQAMKDCGFKPLNSDNYIGIWK